MYPYIDLCIDMYSIYSEALGRSPPCCTCKEEESWRVNSTIASSIMINHEPN